MLNPFIFFKSNNNMAYLVILIVCRYLLVLILSKISSKTKRFMKHMAVSTLFHLINLDNPFNFYRYLFFFSTIFFFCLFFVFSFVLSYYVDKDFWLICLLCKLDFFVKLIFNQIAYKIQISYL